MIIPHSDGAGVIEAVGSGVPESRIGERVYVYQAQFGRSLGTAAEYMAIPSRRAVNLPDHASFEVGAAVGIPMLTAYCCVFSDGPVKDKILLITGGAGRVGYYAIQWALRGGARVLATASNKEDRQACLDLGVEAIAMTDEVLRTDAFSHRIAEILPLDQCARAHNLIERGAPRGVVLLSI